MHCVLPGLGLLCSGLFHAGFHKTDELPGLPGDEYILLPHHGDIQKQRLLHRKSHNRLAGFNNLGQQKGTRQIFTQKLLMVSS